MGKQRRTDDRREVLGSTDTCTHVWNFTRKTANLELEMFVTGENLLKERINTKSSRVTNAVLKTLRRLLLLKPNKMIAYSQCERVERSWMKPPITARRCKL